MCKWALCECAAEAIPRNRSERLRASELGLEEWGGSVEDESETLHASRIEATTSTGSFRRASYEISSFVRVFMLRSIWCSFSYLTRG